MKIGKTIILPLLLYAYEMWSLILGEESRMFLTTGWQMGIFGHKIKEEKKKGEN